MFWSRLEKNKSIFIRFSHWGAASVRLGLSQRSPNAKKKTAYDWMTVCRAEAEDSQNSNWWFIGCEWTRQCAIQSKRLSSGPSCILPSCMRAHSWACWIVVDFSPLYSIHRTCVQTSNSIHIFRKCEIEWQIVVKPFAHLSYHVKIINKYATHASRSSVAWDTHLNTHTHALSLLTVLALFTPFNRYFQCNGGYRDASVHF